MFKHISNMQKFETMLYPLMQQINTDNTSNNLFDLMYRYFKIVYNIHWHCLVLPTKNMPIKELSRQGSAIKKLLYSHYLSTYSSYYQLF